MLSTTPELRRVRRTGAAYYLGFDLAYDPIAFKKTKHILRAANGLRDYVARDVFTLIWLSGSVNLADILTKAQAVSVFTGLMQSYDSFVNAVGALNVDDTITE